MTLVAVTHGYPGISGWPMGGEVSLHRTLTAANMPVTVLTRTTEPYELDGIDVQQIAIADALDINTDPAPLVEQLRALGATAVLAQNELSLPAVRAAKTLGIPSIVSVHTPPKYGRALGNAVAMADHRIYNTTRSAREWRHPGIVIHPPVGALPKASTPKGDAITLLSNLHNKGAGVALKLAAIMPNQRFIIVRSPAEPTHGLENFDVLAAALPNVEVGERVGPDEVAERYLSQTRIVIIPSRMETYGMSAIEAAGHGIPSVSIMNAHVAEGIGDAAYGTAGLDLDGTELGIYRVNANYAEWSAKARARAEWIADRQVGELASWATFASSLSQ